VSSVWNEVLVAASRIGLVVLEDQEFSYLIDGIRRRYLASRPSIWWWDSLKVPSRRIDYGDNSGLARLRAILPDRNDLVLVATDEVAVPHGGVRGSAVQLVQLVGDCSGFEFAVVPPDLEWIVFDTHHSELVIAGQLGRGVVEPS
jgi:hypothetical protein